VRWLAEPVATECVEVAFSELNVGEDGRRRRRSAAGRAVGVGFAAPASRTSR
jgi:hypothetical protein